MENAVLTLTFLLWVGGLVAYIRSLDRVLLWSKRNNLSVFGEDYSSLSGMGSDTHFLNNLWSGKEIKDHSDTALVGKLSLARKLLLFQMTLSVLIFFALMLKAILQA